MISRRTCACVEGRCRQCLRGELAGLLRDGVGNNCARSLRGFYRNGVSDDFAELARLLRDVSAMIARNLRGC